MIIENLKLVNWRGYKNLDLTFSPKLNLILGENGSGKSNLAEAIYYTSLTRSWRTNDSKVLVNFDSNETSIFTSISRGVIKKEIQIYLSKGKKKVWINNKLISGLSDLSKCLNIIVFSPSDVPLFLDSPSLRRNFLDISICKENLNYQESLSNYNALLNQRNTLLKDERIDLDLLSILTTQLVLEATKITKERNSYISKLNRVLPKVIQELLKKDVDISLKYDSFIPLGDSMNEVAEVKFNQSRETDLKLQHTTIGPHKEDFSLILNGKDISSYGSQGQNRLGVLALKLSPYFLVEKEEDKPIVVLDDVTSELDETNQNNLLEFVKTKLSQVFITATNLDIKGATVIDVASNIASRRN